MKSDLLNMKSLLLLAIIGAIYGLVALFYPFLIDWNREPDILLGLIWTVMTLSLLFKPELSRDLMLLVVGLVGGLLIEAWGTNTELWVYATRERPPIWIVPAWPVAALCIDRLARVFEHLVPGIKRVSRLYWALLPAFIVFFTTLLWPSITMASSMAVMALMIGVTFVKARPERDLTLFLMGSFLGIFLEYWGTSRHCWTYWTGEVPPLQAVFAHGFASVAFSRGVQLLRAISKKLSAFTTEARRSESELTPP